MYEEPKDVAVDVALIKRDICYLKEVTGELKDIMGNLTIATNRLTITISKGEGIKEGQSSIIKWVRIIFGSFCISWVIWVSSSTMSNSTDNVIIKDKIFGHKKEKS